MSKLMSTRLSRMAAVGASLLAATLLAGCTSRVESQEGQEAPGAGFAAVPGLTGGQDVFGPYEAVPNWPRPMSESLPGHEKWTYSVTMDVQRAWHRR